MDSRSIFRDGEQRVYEETGWGHCREQHTQLWAQFPMVAAVLGPAQITPPVTIWRSWSVWQSIRITLLSTQASVLLKYPGGKKGKLPEPSWHRKINKQSHMYVIDCAGPVRKVVYKRNPSQGDQETNPTVQAGVFSTDCACSLSAS